MIRRFVVALLALAASVIAPVAVAQDAAAGERKAAMCIGCHGIVGYQASFPQVYKVPKIAGQTVEYMTAALNDYRKGDRKHPTMRAIAGALTDADIADLAAYYQQLGAAPAVADAPSRAPTAEVAALVAKGVCASCHGANFNQPLAPGYPKIAGQHADYLYTALRAYATHGNPRVGRNNAIMVAQVKPFTPRELKLLADYIGSLDGQLRTVPDARFK